MNNKDEIRNNLILIDRRLTDTIYLAMEEKELEVIARDLEDVQIKLKQLLNEVDNTNF